MQASQPLPLKDIHLPEPVSWWPPATGYWLILALIIFLLAVFLLLRYFRSRNRVRKAAMKEFKTIKQQYQLDLDDKQLVSAIATLIRRAAISSYPRTDCASLTGSDWLHWLDDHFKSDKRFSDGAGSLLTEFNYSTAGHAENLSELLDLTDRWLKQLPLQAGKLNPLSRESAK